MKKLIRLVVFLMITCLLTCNHFHDVYAIQDGDNCPKCGGQGTITHDVVNMPVNCWDPPVTVTYYCNSVAAVCDYTETVTYYPPDHSWQVITEPTCDTPGQKRCVNCRTTEEIPATGHHYSSSVTLEPTCDTDGEKTYTCSGCHDTYKVKIDKLGHNYKSKVTKDATCTEDGVKTFTCSRCGDKYTETIKALGHDYKETITKDATCTEDGSKEKKCKNCGDSNTEIIPQLGHDVTLTITKQPTCIEEGLESGTCKRCNDEIKNVLPALGHKYPDEWTVEKESTLTSEGLEVKVCEVCGDKLSQAIPKKSSTPIIIGGASAVTAAGVIFGILKKRAAKKTVKKVSKKVAEEIAEKVVEKSLPSIEDRTLLICGNDDEFTDFLKLQRYLQIVTTTPDELEKAITDNEPDLTIININDEFTLDQFLDIKNEDNSYSLILNSINEDTKEKLKELKDNKEIIDYVRINTNKYVKLVKLVLPICKPSLTSDEGLENIGLVADALGIPFISTITDTYIAGREIKETIQEGELGVNETSTIIGDIASILGLDKISTVTDLIDDVYTIKDTVGSEKGVYDIGEGKDAVSDIIDVVSDIIDK